MNHQQTEPQGHRPESGSQRDSLLRELGIAMEVSFLPDTSAPPVDKELVELIVRNELPAEQARAVLELVVLYRPWHEAYTKLLVEGCKSKLARGRQLSCDPGIHGAKKVAKDGTINI